MSPSLAVQPSFSQRLLKAHPLSLNLKEEPETQLREPWPLKCGLPQGGLPACRETEISCKGSSGIQFT